MAIYHLKYKYGSKSNKQSARAKADYILREGKFSPDAQEVLRSGFGNMPRWVKCPTDYWQAADDYERKNATLYREIEFALPCELSLFEQTAAVKAFIQDVTGGEHPFTYAIHKGKDRNPHCHFIFHERFNDGIDRTPAHWFRRANKTSPELGGAIKVDCSKKDFLKRIRQAWEDRANAALEAGGHDERISCKTLSLQAEEARALARQAAEEKDLGMLEYAHEKLISVSHFAQAHVGPGKEYNSSVHASHREEQLIINERLNKTSQQIKKELADELGKDRRNLRKKIRAEKKKLRIDDMAAIDIEPTDFYQTYKSKLLKAQYEGLNFNPTMLKYVDTKKHSVALRDGANVVDLGSQISADRATQSSAQLMAEIAKAKGWPSVEINADSLNDFLIAARELTLRGIVVSNDSPVIQAEVERVKTQMTETYSLKEDVTHKVKFLPEKGIYETSQPNILSRN